ncbi:MAG: sensor histidine kinase, partial [Spirochaetales bacterium]|nr:sensor histidine kinase [Spirochaetales bacterium]
GKDSGLIEITLDNKNGDVTLIIQDDGNGLPENFILEEQQGFGLMLIDSYSKQLDGSFTIVNNNGTKSTLKFTM